MGRFVSVDAEPDLDRLAILEIIAAQARLMFEAELRRDSVGQTVHRDRLVAFLDRLVDLNRQEAERTG
jgi:hypothetical protein